MKQSDIPFKSLDAEREPHLQAAYQAAAAMSIGGLSRQEKKMLVHQWAINLVAYIKATK
jgi:hypothetical protein